MSHANIPRSRRFSLDTTVSGIREFGFGANFDPLDLFAGGKQGVWYDPSDKSMLFQDVAGTVPVTEDGDPVALIRDKSGNGNHAIQETAAARPIYRTDGNLHWLEFDGVDDYLLITVNSEVPQPYFFGVGMRQTKSSSSAYVYDSRTSGGSGSYVIQRGSETNINVGEPQVKGEYLPTLSNKGVFSFIANGLNSKVHARGDAIEVALGNSTFKSTFLGAKAGGVGVMGYDLFGLVVANTADMVEANDYLARKAGVTL